VGLLALIGSVSWAQPYVIEGAYESGAEKFALFNLAPFLIGAFIVGLVLVLIIIVQGERQ
jgi:hypothetical protein